MARKAAELQNLKNCPSPDGNGILLFWRSEQKIKWTAGSRLRKTMKKIFIFPLLLILLSCYDVARDCKDFKTGTYRSEITINGVKHTTTSIRTDSLVIETYKGKTDTASIRWVNDCEYILRKLHPKNMAEQKAISIRILTTSKNSYTFEFGGVGNDSKQKGTAVLIDN
jgi:hypothetical protein